MSLKVTLKKDLIGPLYRACRELDTTPDALIREILLDFGVVPLPTLPYRDAHHFEIAQEHSESKIPVFIHNDRLYFRSPSITIPCKRRVDPGIFSSIRFLKASGGCISYKRSKHITTEGVQFIAEVDRGWYAVPPILLGVVLTAQATFTKYNDLGFPAPRIIGLIHHDVDEYLQEHDPAYEPPFIHPTRPPTNTLKQKRLRRRQTR